MDFSLHRVFILANMYNADTDICNNKIGLDLLTTAVLYPVILK